MKLFLIFLITFLIPVIGHSQQPLPVQDHFIETCEQLSLEQIKDKYNELDSLQAQIQDLLSKRAPSYLYNEYIKQQKQWKEEQKEVFLECIKNNNKNELCRMYFLETLRIGVVLEVYSEYLYGL